MSICNYTERKSKKQMIKVKTANKFLSLIIINLYTTGITGVPFFEISAGDSQVTQKFSGAQSIDTIIAVIKRASMNAKV